MKVHDVLIIGASPAGLAAGLYVSRSKLDTIVLEKGGPGGQIVITDEISNYPGSMENATGPILVARMVEQAKSFGAEIIKDEVVDLNLTANPKIVTCKENTYYAKSVIIATGGKPRPIGCPGEAKLAGKGVSYCATCDADFLHTLKCS